MTVRPDLVGEPCSLYIDLEPGEQVGEGDWIASPGTAYLVTHAHALGPAAAIRGERRKVRWSLWVVRHRLDDIPEDAKVISMHWYER